MTKTFPDNCDKNIVQQTSCEPLFPDVRMQSKTYFFVPFVRPCMHYKYGGISERLNLLVIPATTSSPKGTHVDE